MRWTPGGESGNIEDRRGSGGIGPVHVGIGGTVILIVLSLIFGRDFVSDNVNPNPYSAGSSAAGSLGPGGPNGPAAPVDESPQEAKEVQFVSFVLDTAEATWAKILPATTGTAWRNAKLVLFRDATQTGCGVGQTAMGPFYCPVDQKLYIDLAFFDELRSRFGEAGDLESGLNAAAAVGDDRLERQTTGHVNTDTFTHGSSAQRVQWFRRGFDSGQPKDCDTFNGAI
jgi:predicted metalloprotease